MRGLLAVLGREIRERRLLGLLALALGAAAVAFPLLPGARPAGMAMADLQGGLALGLALLLTMLLALFLGGSIVAGDLAERRLGFYFSRPLSGWAIWGGKMAAALLLVLGSGVAVLAPAVLLGRSLNGNGLWGVDGLLSVSGSGVFLVWAAGLLALFLAAQAASVIVRARSAWALLDLAALAAAAALVWGTVRWLRRAGVYLYGFGSRTGILFRMGAAFFAAVLLALAVAGALQVVRGRTDLRRAHQVLSLTLWGAVLAAAVLFAGCGAWVLAAGPEDLRGFYGVSAAPGSSWIAFSGPAAHRAGYNPGFFYDLATGRSLRTRFKLVSFYTVYEQPTILVRFAADGRRAVWLENDGEEASPFLGSALYRMDLGRPGARPVPAPVSFSRPPRSFALSPDGRRVAAIDWSGRLTVFAVDDGRMLASVKRDDDGGAPFVAFAGPGRLRVYAIRSSDVSAYVPEARVPSEILEIDLDAGHPVLQRTGTLAPLAGSPREAALSPDGSRLLLRGRDDLLLLDGRTGALLARLGGRGAHGDFLGDGRVAVTDPAPGGRELRLFSPDGGPAQAPVLFPGARAAIVADPAAAGPLRVVTSRPGAPAGSWELWQVDPEGGGARPLRPLRLASLKLPEIARGPVDLAGKDGVVWLELRAGRERVALREPAAPAAAPPRR